MNQPITQRNIDVTIKLGAGEFGEKLGDTMTLSGYRVQAQIEFQSNGMMGQAAVKVFGLPINTLNRLTMIGPEAMKVLAQSSVEIVAHDTHGAHMPYQGTIWQAWANMREAPNTALEVVSLRGMVANLKPVPASSYVGSVQVADIMADFAKEAGWTFENNGVDVTLSNPYFPGTTLAKIRKCADAAGVNFAVLNGLTLAIWPGYGSRTSQPPIIVSPQSGLVGYPSFSQNMVNARCLFNPAIEMGARVTIQGSQLTAANRTWTVNYATHTLESQTPNGAWFTDFVGAMWGEANG